MNFTLLISLNPFLFSYPSSLVFHVASCRLDQEVIYIYTKVTISLIGGGNRGAMAPLKFKTSP